MVTQHVFILQISLYKAVVGFLPSKFYGNVTHSTELEEKTTTQSVKF